MDDILRRLDEMEMKFAEMDREIDNDYGLRLSVLGQDRSQTNRSWSWSCRSCVVLCLVTLVVVTIILKDTETFQVLFCTWNITTVEINSGVYLLKS